MMSPRTGKYGRLRQVWTIIAHDPLALTEIVSGLFLVALRGAWLLGAPSITSTRWEVASLLQNIEVTDARWGSYLMVCGILQIALAPETTFGARHAIYRLIVTFLILFGFVVMGAAFWVGLGFTSVPASVICMATFYTYLTGRVWAEYRDRRERDGNKDVPG